MREEYRKDKKYLNCVLSKEEFKKIKTNSKSHWKTPTTYLRESAIAYSKQKFLIPENIKEQLERFIFILRSIANNINQIVKHINTKHSAWKAEIIEIKNTVHWLESLIKSFIENPEKHNDN